MGGGHHNSVPEFAGPAASSTSHAISSPSNRFKTTQNVKFDNSETFFKEKGMDVGGEVANGRVVESKFGGHCIIIHSGYKK